MILISASNLAAEKANSAAALAAAEISRSDWPQEWLRLIYFNSIKRRNIEKSLYIGRRPRRQPQAQRPATGAAARSRRSRRSCGRVLKNWNLIEKCFFKPGLITVFKASPASTLRRRLLVYP